MVRLPKDQDVEIRRLGPHVTPMNYLLAILLPPLSIFLAGRPIMGILLVPIWILALFFSGGLTHPMFILLAWIVIFERRQARSGG
ncbi:hypothetical protein [Gymnodinialimonas mytili]|uniref:hypothetical protein n=1 Tax=Gymnodinialimonas mytili TaxID=3126503 RepID=UPI003F7238A9